MSIGGKLRLVNGIMLFVPVLLAVLGITVIYLSIGSGDYGNILEYLNDSDNVSDVYSMCNQLYNEYQSLIESEVNVNEKMIDALVADNEDIGSVEIKKNSEIIYERKDEPDNFEYIEYDVFPDTGDNNQFIVSNGKIYFRGVIEKDNSVYEINICNKVSPMGSVKRNNKFYSDWIKTNVFFLIIVIVIVHSLSNLFYKSIFKRVEYSLGILSDAVDKISDGDLEYRINYDRDDEFKPICDDFNLMTLRLYESVNMIQKQEQNRKEIIMSISHDLFSPLTSIKAYVEGIESGIASTPEIQKKYLNTIKIKAEQIESMVSELLLFSKLEFEEYMPLNEQMDLGEFMKEYIDAVENDYRMRNICLTLEKCDSVSIVGDKSLVSRMITNIIDNSGKYSNKSECHVNVSLENKGDTCILNITDDGPGIPEESIGNIFDIFYRSDAARNHTGMGSGIGLSIVNSIATKTLKGAIRAENTGSGLAMIIQIPTIK